MELLLALVVVIIWIGLIFLLEKAGLTSPDEKFN
jgi:hypothetical protein